MDDPLRIIAAEEGVFLRREARDCGYTDAAILAMRRQGTWRRVRRGCYCFADVWQAASPEERHLILLRAVLRTTPGPVAVSHTSALVLRGVPVWSADLGRVHVTRLDSGSARVEHDVTHHVGLVADGDLETVDGLLVTRPARAVVETATVLDIDAAVVAADSAMHLGHADPDEIHRAFAAMNHWPNAQRIHLVVRYMDGRRESVGESRSFMLFLRHRLPRPEPQFEVYDADGQLVGIVDFAWPDLGVFGEFDGQLKYTRLLKPGEDASAAVWREKQREDLIRALTGFVFVRIVWADLQRPQATADRLRTVLRRTAWTRPA